jgi:hypothetical protein
MEGAGLGNPRRITCPAPPATEAGSEKTSAAQAPDASCEAPALPGGLHTEATRQTLIVACANVTHGIKGWIDVSWRVSAQAKCSRVWGTYGSTAIASISTRILSGRSRLPTVVRAGGLALKNSA